MGQQRQAPQNQQQGQTTRPSEQPAQGQAQQGQAGQGQVNLSPEQRTRIAQTVLSDRNAPRVDNVNFSLSVGTVVPSHVRVAPVHSALIEINPAWRGHEYFIVRDEIVIVDNGRRVVATVPVGSSGERVGSGTSIRGGGTAVSGGAGRTAVRGGAMDLSVEEIQQIQMVLREQGFDVEVDGRLGPRTKQALIEFQRRQGLQATGTIDQQTVAALGVSVRGMGGAQGTMGQGGAQGTTGTTTGQGGMQQPGNKGSGGTQSGQTGNQPSTSGEGTTQQPPANQGPGTSGQRSQSGNQPSSTSGQGGTQQPPANQNNMNQNNMNRGSSNPSGAGTPAQQPK
jgi:peptidoglycan hydrolase-like protein with peptidoglycan-binding domain